MSAIDTATRVLEWASSPAGPPPPGDLRDLEALAEPGAELRAALGRLAALTAARMTLASPPLGDAAPPGPAALWLAVAVGAASRPEASEIVRCCAPADSAWELIARHAVVGRVWEHVPPILAETLLGASPLSALLTVPPRGEEDAIRLLGEGLLEHRDGRRLLVSTFSQPEDLAPLLAWRGSLLDGLRQAEAHRTFVLDVYEAAIALHRDAWLDRIRAAGSVLADPAALPETLEFALAVAGWWEALRNLHRSHLDWLRERKYMDFHVYLQGIKVASFAARLRGGELR